MVHSHLLRDVFSYLAVVIVQICQQISWGSNLQVSQLYLLGVGDIIYGNALALGDDVLIVEAGTTVVEYCLCAYHQPEYQFLGQ